MLTNQNPALTMIEIPQLGGYYFPEDGSEHTLPIDITELFFNKWKCEKKFPMAHFNFSEPFREFSDRHPKYVKIIQIRDLRDVLVSCAFYQQNEIEAETGLKTLDEQLMYLIKKNKHVVSPKIMHIYRHARNAAEWVGQEDVYVCRFESLVGPKGGGNINLQQENIVNLANMLNIPLDNEKLTYITANLFGNQTGPDYNMTFREGKIGGWRQYFKEEHKRAFMEEGWAELQLKLGYDLNW